jgi:hypothetical protein
VRTGAERGRHSGAEVRGFLWALLPPGMRRFWRARALLAVNTWICGFSRLGMKTVKVSVLPSGETSIRCVSMGLSFTLSVISMVRSFNWCAAPV